MLYGERTEEILAALDDPQIVYAVAEHGYIQSLLGSTHALGKLNLALSAIDARSV